MFDLHHLLFNSLNHAAETTKTICGTYANVLIPGALRKFVILLFTSDRLVKDCQNIYLYIQIRIF